MINIVLFGKPGSGKGTQAKFLKSKYHLFHISTGDLFRHHISNKTDLGQLAQSFMNKGDLVPDRVTIDMLKDAVETHSDTKGFIFDGFPRNIEQAKNLEIMLKKHDQNLSKVLNLKVDYSVLIKRISGRISCSVCKNTYNEYFDPPPQNCRENKMIKRSDDNEETITKRLKIYDNETLPLLEYYKNQNKVINIDAMKQIDEVRKEIKGVLKD